MYHVCTTEITMGGLLAIFSFLNQNATKLLFVGINFTLYESKLMYCICLNIHHYAETYRLE